MSNQTSNNHEGSNRLYMVVWIALLALTAIEVWLAYLQVFSTGGMLTILMLLSLVKAALIIAYFMHLRFEKTTLVLSLIPPVTVVVALLAVFFPDGVRALELAVR
jgi:cytochrome c oxidase subunit IV